MGLKLQRLGWRGCATGLSSPRNAFPRRSVANRNEIARAGYRKQWTHQRCVDVRRAHDEARENEDNEHAKHDSVLRLRIIIPGKGVPLMTHDLSRLSMNLINKTDHVIIDILP